MNGDGGGHGRGGAGQQDFRGDATSDPTLAVDLVGAVGWMRLTPAVRARFAPGVSASFIGEGWFERSRFGLLWAMLGVLSGRPLPLRAGPARVEIDVRADRGGDVWSRTYRFDDGGVEVARSVKHAGRGAWLEERAGPLIMRLKVFEQDRVLIFDCMNFLLRLGAVDLALPLVLTPGRICVEHHDLGDGRFRFTLEARHPWFGLTFRQHCDCQDVRIAP